MRKFLYLTVFLFLLVLSCKTRSEMVEVSPTEAGISADSLRQQKIIALGKDLFFDTRLSLDGTISCASCHRPELAFADNKVVAEGIEGRKALRNVPSILNLATATRFMYEGQVPTLEMQVLVPIQDHNEMDMPMDKLIERLRAIPSYSERSKVLFRRDIDPMVLTKSLAAFERTLTAQQSRFDAYLNGKKDALTKEEIAGWKLFSERLYCLDCHALPNFTSNEVVNTGLYSVYSKDPGRMRATNLQEDMGKFKVPSLRNCALTYPYMHDGSMSTLQDVIAHYSKGGSKHVNQHPSIRSFELTTSEKLQLEKFLRSLTDTSYISRFR